MNLLRATRNASECSANPLLIASCPSLVFRVSVICVCLACIASAPAQSVSFRKHVAAILAKRCLTCHGEQKFKGEYQLHTLKALM